MVVVLGRSGGFQPKLGRATETTVPLDPALPLTPDTFPRPLIPNPWFANRRT
jgi:hypothetical protein